MNEQDNFGRLSQAVALLRGTLRPYVERELKADALGGDWSFAMTSQNLNLAKLRGVS